MEKLSIYEIKIIKFIKKNNGAMLEEIEQKFSETSDTVIAKLIELKYIYQANSEDQKLFYPGTLLTLPPEGKFYITDKWETYSKERRKHLAENIKQKIKNPIVWIVATLATAVVTEIVSSLFQK